MPVRLSKEESERIWLVLLGVVFGAGCLVLGVVVAVLVSYGQPVCFDELKRPVPCSTVPVVTVPEPARAGAWEPALAVIAFVGFWLAAWWMRRRR